MELWSAAVHDLGLSNEEFLSLTPRQFDALVRRHQEKERRADYRAGVIASTMANMFRGSGSRALKPADFFPGLEGDAKPQSGHTMALILRQFCRDMDQRKKKLAEDRGGKLVG